MTRVEISILIRELETINFNALTPVQRAFAQQWKELKEDNPKRAETLREWYARRWKSIKWR